MNPQQSIIFHLVNLSKIISHRANALFQNAGYKIRVEQAPVLMTLCNNGRLSQQELANILGRDKSSIQRTIVSLTRNGLVSIGADRFDKRKNIIELTDSGKTLSNALLHNIKDVEYALFGHLDESALQRLISRVNELE